jgi:sugar phosphate isomerase/epimerase
VLETAAGLQAPLVCLDVGNLPDKDTTQVDAALSELGRRADRYSVVVALRSELASLAALQRAMKSAACPWFGLDLDPVAALHDDWSIAEIFARMGNLIRHVRGRDALLGADRRTHSTPIGDGSVDWPQLPRLLNEAGFSGWISIDPMDLTDRRAGAAAGLRHLKAP